MASLAGSFLVARTVLQDPNFRQTVVLLLQHGDEGALGLVVNRQTKAAGVPFPIFVGGPCQEQSALRMLHGHAEWAADQGVAPGIYVGDKTSFERATTAATEDAIHFRVFAGYAGWGPGQLEGELAAGAWTLTPANGELLFQTPPEDLWERLVPPRLPQPSLN
jgi:putative transcriptional regulator